MSPLDGDSAESSVEGLNPREEKRARAREGRRVTEAEAERAIFEAARSTPGTRDPTLVSSEIDALAPYRPGPPVSHLTKILGVKAEDLLLLASNENLLGPSEKALEAAASALETVHLYPDGGAHDLRRALATRHGVSPDRIVIGNGTTEILELLVRTFVGPGETVVTAWPSFVVYSLATQAHGRELLFAPLRNDRYDLASMAALVDRRTKLVFIANPNNPTGTYVPKRHLAAFLDRIPRSVIVVLDEAYAEYADADDYPEGIRAFPRRTRLVVLKTFSKVYGLAGLRIGYGVMDPVLADHVHAVRQPYNVNTVAQHAALAALDDESHVRNSVRVVREGRRDLLAGARRLGLEPIPSATNFMVIRFPCDAAPIVEALEKMGIIVRDMKPYDMPEALRVTVGTRAMNLRFLSALEDCWVARQPQADATPKA